MKARILSTLKWCLCYRYSVLKTNLVFNRYLPTALQQHGCSSFNKYSRTLKTSQFLASNWKNRYNETEFASVSIGIEIYPNPICPYETSASPQDTRGVPTWVGNPSCTGAGMILNADQSLLYPDMVYLLFLTTTMTQQNDRLIALFIIYRIF